MGRFSKQDHECAGRKKWIDRLRVQIVHVRGGGGVAAPTAPTKSPPRK